MSWERASRKGHGLAVLLGDVKTTQLGLAKEGLRFVGGCPETDLGRLGPARMRYSHVYFRSVELSAETATGVRSEPAWWPGPA